MPSEHAIQQALGFPSRPERDELLGDQLMDRHGRPTPNPAELGNVDAHDVLPPPVVQNRDGLGVRFGRRVLKPERTEQPLASAIAHQRGKVWLRRPVGALLAHIGWIADQFEAQRHRFRKAAVADHSVGRHAVPLLKLECRLVCLFAEDSVDDADEKFPAEQEQLPLRYSLATISSSKYPHDPMLATLLSLSPPTRTLFALPG
ncbi:MAG: hypothetical protein V3V08_21990 [Nannocystaceae bacterium]